MSGKEEDRVAALEERMRAIKAKHTSGRKISCKSCTHPTHEPGQCPGKKVKFFFFFFFFMWTNKTFQSFTSMFNSQKKTSKNLPGRIERTHAIAEDKDSETDNNQVGKLQNFRKKMSGSQQVPITNQLRQR